MSEYVFLYEGSVIFAAQSSPDALFWVLYFPWLCMGCNVHIYIFVNTSNSSDYECVSSPRLSIFVLFYCRGFLLMIPLNATFFHMQYHICKSTILIYFIYIYVS